MSHSKGSNAAKAGAFVILSILLTIAVVLALAGVREKLRPTTDYVVRFDLSQGAAGLAADSAVRVGGRDVGRVTGIRFEEGPGGAVTGVLVEIAVARSLTIHEGATAFLERPLLGSGAVLNFESLGDQAIGRTLGGGATIPGEPQVPQFLAQAGYGSTQREQLQSILSRAEDLTLKMDEAVNGVRTIIAKANDRSDGWLDRADTIFGDAESAMKEIKDGVGEGRSLIASLQSGVNDNRPRLDETIRNIQVASADARSAVEHFNDETLILADDLLRNGRDAAQEARAAVERVDRLLAEQTPSLRKTMANARLASDQMRLATGEIRRTPWRLLYRPSEKELEFELLYDAARAYADAVSDLRDAGETLGAVSDLGAGNTGVVQGYAESITGAFEKYQEAETRFLDLLIGETP